MKIKNSILRSTALLIAAFLVTLALPLTGAMAAGSSIVITNSDKDHYEGGAEDWQLVGSFTIESTHLPISAAQLIIIANDVDAPAETDRIRVRNAGGDTVLLGRLTGMNGQDNTTVLDVPTAFLTAGNYTLELDMGSTVDGVLGYRYSWVVTIRSATLILDGGVGAFGAAASFNAVGTNVDTRLDLSSLTTGETYNLEYKFINLTQEKQIASATGTYTATGATGQVLRTLTLNSIDAITDDNAYQLDIIITNGSNYVTARATLGAQQEDYNTYYEIKIVTNEGGSVNPSSPTYAIAGQNSHTIAFIPSEGYAVQNVKIDGVSMGALENYTFEKVTADHMVEVEFIPLAAPPQTGSVSVIGLAILALLCSTGCFVLARKKS